MIKRMELLVHAGAPSHTRRDDRYRAQAQAYAGFEAAVIIPLGEHVIPDGQTTQLKPSEDHVAGNAPGEHARAAAVFLDDTRLAYTALDSQLLTSSLLHSFGEESRSDATQEGSYEGPAIRSGTKRKRGSQPEEIGSSSPPSNSRSDNTPATYASSLAEETRANGQGSTTSSYLKSPKLQRSCKRPRLDVRPVGVRSEPLLGDHERSLFTTPIKELPKRAQASDPPNNPVDRCQGSTDGNQTTSELPTSYSLSDITSDSSRRRLPISQRSSSDPGPQIGSISPTAPKAVPTPHKPSLQHSKPHLHANAINRHPERQSPKTSNKPEPLVANRAVLQTDQPAPDISSIRDKRTHIPATSNTSLAALKALSASIRPSQPLPAVHKFKTHVTESLQFLADNVDVNKAYKPVSTSRELRPLERGYWLIRCPEQSDSWPLSDQIDFWRFLERTIGKGNAGWGVWCIRNDDETPVGDQPASLGTMKVFCWGEIVRHLYLLLYIGSRSKVKRLGLQWVDAEGKVVVQMRNG